MRSSNRRKTRVGLAAAAGAVAAALVLAAPAGAAIPTTLSSPANCTVDNTAPESYVFCDDGVPATAGGLVANEPLDAAVTVPARYGGDGFTGLPLKDATAPLPAGADTAGNIALDVDISIPLGAAPAGGYPLIVMMHGCCGGEKTNWEAQNVAAGSRFDAGGERWHYNNAWFASRGYVVLNYTARGFINAGNRGSTGEMKLDSRRFEINDFQALACESMAQAGDFSAAAGHPVSINPNGVVATGGSYGGGFSWMALTDPKWTCNPDTGAAGTDMSLVAAAAKYGWTDLVSSLVPTGHQGAKPSNLPPTDGCGSGPVKLDGSACPQAAPIGIPKRSIVNALYLSGTGLLGSHTTFPPEIIQAFGCISGPYPVETAPGCASTFGPTLQQFLNDSSAYYQNGFFAKIATDPSYVTPVFDAATLTDPLFPALENRRMINRLREVVSDYPVQAYYGDYQHFTQNKAKLWGDVCTSGGNRHVCTNSDFGGAFNSSPASLARLGVTTRLNNFIDYFARPAANPGAQRPGFDVTAELQVCPDNAADLGVPTDESGPQFTAATFEKLAPREYVAEIVARRRATSIVSPNEHAENSDPVTNAFNNRSRCPVVNDSAGSGVGTYTTPKLERAKTMIGATRVKVDFKASGTVTQIDARLYDVIPGGKAVLVDRGPRRLRPSESRKGRVSFELQGNGWRFQKGHRIRIELTQDDDPYVHESNGAPASTARIRRVRLSLPVREKGKRCENPMQGSAKGEKLRGSSGGDEIDARGGNDRATGRKGADCILGGAGKDRINGGKGRDRLRGGAGNDKIKARDGRRDIVNCGKGNDRAKVDASDRVRGCETVRLRRRR
ncbi:MAG: CocE/NonD family hydrolase C-terminal non-catalytic domain-containing protein [Actinomycetota bacterium]